MCTVSSHQLLHLYLKIESYPSLSLQEGLSTEKYNFTKTIEMIMQRFEDQEYQYQTYDFFKAD